MREHFPNVPPGKMVLSLFQVPSSSSWSQILILSPFVHVLVSTRPLHIRYEFCALYIVYNTGAKQMLRNSRIQGGEGLKASSHVHSKPHQGHTGSRAHIMNAGAEEEECEDNYSMYYKVHPLKRMRWVEEGSPCLT